VNLDSKISRIYGTVTGIEEIGEGMRVCLDLVDLLQSDEGILVGNTGYGYTLVLAETRETDLYPPRPFRVNCGSIHQYMKNDDKTCYLSEIKPGQLIEVVGLHHSRKIAVGRVKMERRPLMRIELKNEQQVISVTLQSSESVYVFTDKEGPKQAIHLRAGDRVLISPDTAGRHLGTRIEEEIMEF
jgi:3-dehydroquinate synthase II